MRRLALFAENFELGDSGFERVRLKAAPHIIFNDLRHGWDAVPLQNSDAQSFSATTQAVGRSWEVLEPQRGERLVATQFQECPLYTAYFLFSILAHVSFSATVRLNTGFPGAESGSTQKYPKRSNW